MENETAEGVEKINNPRYLKLRQGIFDYALRKEGIASMMEHLVGKVYKEPDLDPEILFELTDEYSKLIGLDEEMSDLTNFTIAKYIGRRKKIKEVREAFPCDDMFFKTVCGSMPEEELQIDMRPITFNFVCHNIRDFALIINKIELEDSSVVNRSKLRAASSIGGRFIESPPFKDPELFGSVIVENAIAGNNADLSIYRQHEEQHALTYFLDSAFFDFTSAKYFPEGNEDIDVPKYLAKLINGTFLGEDPWEVLPQYKKNDKMLEILARLMLRIERKDGENLAKDEILSYLKDYESLTGSQIFDLLVGNESYDYFPEEMKQKTFKDYIKLFKNMVGMKRENMIKRNIQKVFVSEYEILLINALASFNLLQNIGFSTDRALFLLMTEPLKDWRKIAERMFVAKYIQSSNHLLGIPGDL